MQESNPKAGQASRTPHFTVAVLTYNRLESLRALLDELGVLLYPRLEIIVVDNASGIPAATLSSDFPQVNFIRSEQNIGTGGRNLAFAQASGEFIVSLDDDISGLTDAALWSLAEAFNDASIAAICFKVVEAGTGKVTNWVHHKPVEKFSDARFETYEITEGAVAFRKSVLKESGYYPETFFISHEGPDLAFRIMDLGYKVTYEPAVYVIHAYSPLGRTSWRNYYYDTRNTIWLAVRNCPMGFGTRLILRQLCAMLVYSIRDGYLRWWLKGIRDALKGLPSARAARRKLQPATMKRIKFIDRDRPGLLYLVRRRLFQRGVKI